MAGRASSTGPREVHAVALWPGAGTTADHPSLLALEAALAPLPVFRFDFPYRREGRKAPDRANKLIASLRQDVAGLCEQLGTTPEHLVLGGRSMGGRMCSMAVADGLPAAALVLVAYPLHPPGRPDNQRTAHLPALTVPCLFVQGTRDPFGSPDELTAATATIPGPVTHEWIDGGRHDLKGADRRIGELVAAWLSGLGPS